MSCKYKEVLEKLDYYVTMDLAGGTKTWSAEPNSLSSNFLHNRNNTMCSTGTETKGQWGGKIISCERPGGRGIRWTHIQPVPGTVTCIRDVQLWWQEMHACVSCQEAYDMVNKAKEQQAIAEKKMRESASKVCDKCDQGVQYSRLGCSRGHG